LEREKLYDRELKQLKIKWPFERLLVAAAALGILLAGVEAFLLELPLFTLALLAAASATMPPLLLYFGLAYLKARRVRALENALPGALFYAASLPQRTGLEKVLKDLARPENGPLGEEFELAWRRVQAGASLPEALEVLRERSGSPLVERAVDLLLEGYQSGADLSRALQEVAEDALAMRALTLEAKGAMALHKYTLLLGGGLLVPFILGLLLALTNSLQMDVSLFDGVGLGEAQKAALMEAVVVGAQAYLALFAILAGSFVALQEGEAKKAVLYTTALLPLSLLTFHVVQALHVV
jgi:pilus assembly protein TadC